ncbi:MAG: hypothetical protein JNN00_05320 [Chitinophagaceae bacterium]|nr:hypothetical protein [Chitinophagaceae bacterium]
MYHDLYEYLILHKQLNVPGIGTFLLERKPAVTEFTHKQIAPSSYTVVLHPNSGLPAKKLFNWLSDRLSIPYHEAIVKFNSFAFDMKHQILSGNKIVWNEIGTLSKGIAGDIKFEPLFKEHRFDRPVSAVRVIREKAVHTVRVGEEEKTSEEMAKWLNLSEERKGFWWAPALIAGILLVIITGFYFSQKGFNISSAGNQQKLVPIKATDTGTGNP